ncbi:MAG: hypothetical protein ACPHK8_03080, partial [Thermoplasmatota archaeon]
LLRQAGVPKTPGYRTIQFYEYHGAVRTERGIEADARSILTLQGGLRTERALPDRHFIKGPPLETAMEILRANQIQAAIGFQTAANRHAYFEPAGANQLYIQRPAKVTDAAKLTGKILNEFTQHPRASHSDSYELYVDDLTRLDIQEARGEPMTSPIQTLLDLCLHSRTAAHKEFLHDQLRKQEVLHA